MLTRWIDAKISKLPAAEHRFLFSPGLLNHTLNHQPRFLPPALVLHFTAQQLELQLTLICSSKLPFQLSSLEEELLLKKIKKGKLPKTYQIQNFMTQAAFPVSQKFSIITHHNGDNLPAQDDIIKDGIFLYVPLSLLITLRGRAGKFLCG